MFFVKVSLWLISSKNIKLERCPCGIFHQKIFPAGRDGCRTGNFNDKRGPHPIHSSFQLPTLLFVLSLPASFWERRQACPCPWPGPWWGCAPASPPPPMRRASSSWTGSSGAAGTASPPSGWKTRGSSKILAPNHLSASNSWRESTANNGNSLFSRFSRKFWHHISASNSLRESTANSGNRFFSRFSRNF